MKTLIIDDDIPTINLITAYLEILKIKSCTPAVNFAEAKKYLTQNSFDLIILDYKLDHHKTALDLLPSIPPQTKIILISVQNEYKLKKAKQNCPQIQDYLLKEKMPEEFIDKIKTIIVY